MNTWTVAWDVLQDGLELSAGPLQVGRFVGFPGLAEAVTEVDLIRKRIFDGRDQLQDPGCAPAAAKRVISQIAHQELR